MYRRTLLIALLAAPVAAFAKEAEVSKKANTATYVAMQTLSASITRRDGTRGVVTIDNGIDVPDATLRAYALSAQPRLRAACNRLLSNYMAGLPGGAAPNADYLVREFQRITDTTLGKTGARVLVGSILMN